MDGQNNEIHFQCKVGIARGIQHFSILRYISEERSCFTLPTAGTSFQNVTSQVQMLSAAHQRLLLSVLSQSDQHSNVTGYGCVRSGFDFRFIFSTSRPDRPWGPPSLPIG